MPEPIHFHTDLYRREAVQSAAEKYVRKARIALADSNGHIVARLEPATPMSDTDWCDVRGEFCTEALSLTVTRLRDQSAPQTGAVPSASDEPPWELLAPFAEGTPIGLGWVVDSLSPVRGGSASLGLRHQEHGSAQVAIRRNGGAPLGIAHTDRLDFLLMNGGSGRTHTEDSITRALLAMVDTLQQHATAVPDELVAALLPHAERPTPDTAHAGAPRGWQPSAPSIDAARGVVSTDVGDDGVSRLAFYDTVLAFARHSHVFLTRPDARRVTVELRPKGVASPESLATLAQDLQRAIGDLAAKASAATAASQKRGGLPPLPRRRIDLDALLAELDAGDPTTLGVGFQPTRGPGHENLRVLNIRGTGACNSECAFCIEKFNPTHRPMPTTDATRQLIVDGAGGFDMLFFASGEPTIHPKLFEHVELARSVGFTSFGMSSHFRTFADPRFALKTLQAGFEYFDIALHAADLKSQLDVNPIGDGGYSLYEALKGLANLLRLADALGIRISVTHKIVASRLNVTRLLPVFRATYDRGVRHYIVQPVRTLGLEPALQAKLAISEEGILPHLNELLRATEGLGATIKPYGFSRQKLFAGSHVETETNRVKNYYGKARTPDRGKTVRESEARPTDGRHWVEVREASEGTFSFASDGGAPILDDALERGVDLPFGCRMGSCGMCAAHLVEGRIDQSQQIFLTDEQQHAGFVLLCQARPLSDVVVRVCTNDEIDQL
jgi:2Fe-2S type ferredoxin